YIMNLEYINHKMPDYLISSQKFNMSEDHTDSDYGYRHDELISSMFQPHQVKEKLEYAIAQYTNHDIAIHLVKSTTPQEYWHLIELSYQQILREVYPFDVNVLLANILDCRINKREVDINQFPQEQQATASLAMQIYNHLENGN